MLTLLATPAAGQDDPSPRDSLAAAIAAGERAMEADEPRRAIDELRRAEGILGLRMLYGDPERFHSRESATIRRGLARAYLEIGDPYAAAVEASRAVNVAEDDARAWIVLGLARHRLADLEGASRAFGRARGLGTDHPDLDWGEALVASAENRLDEARRLAERALADRAESRYALGLAEWAAVAGDFAASADALERYVRLAPDDPRAEGYRNLARFHRQVARKPAVRIDSRATRVQVGFELVAGDEIPLVPVRFEGRPPAFVILDTGAESNVIDRDYAASIGIDEIHPGGRLHGAYRPTSGGWTIVDRIELGSLAVERVPFAVGDFHALNLRGQGAWYIAGVINPALVFRDFLVVLDYGHRRLELIRYDAGGASYVERGSRLRRTKTPFAFDVNGVWPVMLASVDGSRGLPYLVDTGASDVLIDRRTAGAHLVDPAGFVIAAGGHAREHLRAVLLDERPGEPWGIDVHGILGYPFFRGMRLVFDYRSMTVVLEN